MLPQFYMTLLIAILVVVQKAICPLSAIPLRSAENDLPTLSQVPCGNVESDLPTLSTIPRSNMESKLPNPSTVQRCNAETTLCPVLEVAVEDCGITTISMSTLKNAWNIAERLVCSGSGILNVPWSSDKKARLVMSSSSDHPHLVMTRSGKMHYSCDDKCAMFKGFSLCSHVIAAANDNGDLHSFLEHQNEKKCGPNFTAITSQGMPSGSGRKGGIAKRKRSRVAVPVETRSVRHACRIP